MARHTMDELRQWQALPLSIKVRMSMERIRMWVREYGEEGVYVAFSGGKDSTVLSHLVDRTWPNNQIPRVFVNTGLEYPEIVEFVKKEPRAVIIRPSMNFRQVIEKYGYPMFSKETSEVIYNAKKYLTKLAETATIFTDRQTDRQTDDCRIGTITTAFADAESMKKPSRGGRTQSTENSVDLVSLAKSKDKWEMPFRVAVIMGNAEKNWWKKKMGNIPKNEKDRSIYSMKKYQFMLNAPFEVSHMCCNVMKKSPAHKYAHENNRVCISGEMASESRLRRQKWLQNGCNGFDLTEPKSTPMAFWTEQDVLQYIKENEIEIAPVYGHIVADEEKNEMPQGQLEFTEAGIKEAKCVLKTTGCKRTGCIFCGYGCHLEKEGEGRFERLKVTHPKIYEWIFKDWESGGLGYKKVIDWINEHGGMNIKY